MHHATGRLNVKRVSIYHGAWAQEENKKLRQKQKDKVQPKMGKLDIDYQARHCWLWLLCLQDRLLVLDWWLIIA